MTEDTPPAVPASYDKKVGLVLQGGGALGSYQAGVYEALAASDYMPDWVAGISIGAVNAAIIAGNAPKDRVDRLRGFWEEITAPTMLWPHASEPWLPGNGGQARRWRLRSVNPAFSARIPEPGLHPTSARATTRHRRSKRRWSGSSISTASMPERTCG